MFAEHFCRTFQLPNALKSAKLDKNIAKILLVGLKSAKYGQEYRDFGALKSECIRELESAAKKCGDRVRRVLPPHT